MYSCVQGTLDSVNQLAAQTYSAFNKDGSGSRDSLNSLASQLSLGTAPAAEDRTQQDSGTVSGAGGSSSSDLVSFGSPAAAVTGAAPAGGSSASSGQFFSLGEDDDPVSLSNSNSSTKVTDGRDYGAQEPRGSGSLSSLIAAIPKIKLKLHEGSFMVVKDGIE